MTGRPDLCVLTQNASYTELYDTFSWQIPERYNIGEDICDRWAQIEPDRIALLHKDHKDQSVHKMSYGTLKIKSNQLANALTQHNIHRRDRIGLLLPQSPETAISHVAIYKLGAIAVPLALLFGPEALIHRLANCGAKALITNAAGIEKMSAILNELPDLELVISLDENTQGFPVFSSFIATQNDAFKPVNTHADDPALMVYTSGTTGPPKGALHAHRVLLGHLPGIEFNHEFLPQRGDIMWTPADWAWAGGLMNVLLPGLRYGAPVVSYHFQKFDPEIAFQLMSEFAIRNCFIPPTALKMMRSVNRPAQRYDLALRTIGSGGETLGRETYEWGQRELGLTINEFYGQTECNYVLSSCAHLGVSKPGAIGRPVPGHTVAIIDDQGIIQPPNVTGAIAVKRPDPIMFLEYWDDLDATAKKFIDDWMITGDQGFMDDEGYVHFIGRDDDVITSSGYRIGPGEIEDCLLGHKAVALAAAIGKPDPLRTEIVKVFIVLNAGFTPGHELTLDIQNFVKTRLSAHEYPREITYVDDLPTTTTGKIVRRLLREHR